MDTVGVNVVVAVVKIETDVVDVDAADMEGERKATHCADVVEEVAEIQGALTQEDNTGVQGK